RSRGERPAAPSIRPVPRAGRDLPLSFAQERLWFLDQLEPGSDSYVMPSALRFTGDLDPVSLAAGVGEIVRRHEALRTTFTTVQGRPRQVIAPPAASGWRSPVELPVIDVDRL